jgi:hypothetical protein
MLSDLRCTECFIMPELSSFFYFLSYCTLSVCLLSNLVTTKYKLHHRDCETSAVQIVCGPCYQSFSFSSLYKPELTWRVCRLSQPKPVNPQRADKGSLTKPLLQAKQTETKKDQLSQNTVQQTKVMHHIGAH